MTDSATLDLKRSTEKKRGNPPKGAEADLVYKEITDCLEWALKQPLLPTWNPDVAPHQWTQLQEPGLTPDRFERVLGHTPLYILNSLSGGGYSIRMSDGRPRLGQLILARVMVCWKHVATIPADQRDDKKTKEEVRALMAANDCSHLIANDILAKTDINPANLILEPHDDNVRREWCGVSWRLTYDKVKVLLNSDGGLANAIAIHKAVTMMIQTNPLHCACHANHINCHFICYDSEETKLRHDRLVDLYESYLHPPKQPSTAAAATTTSTTKKRSRNDREAEEEDESKGHSHSEEDTIMTNELDVSGAGDGDDDEDDDTQAAASPDEEEEETSESPAKKPRHSTKDLVCHAVGCGMTFSGNGGGSHHGRRKQHEYDVHGMHEDTIPKCGYVCPVKSFINLNQHRQNNGHGEGDRHKNGCMKAKVTEPKVKCDPCTAHKRKEHTVLKSMWSRHVKTSKHQKASEEYKVDHPDYED